jgi:hypothetical protein
MRITQIRERTVPIASPISNACIDFSKMTCSVVAVITNVVRNGKPVVGYGFNSNGRYGQGCLIRERFRPRILEADPKTLIDEEHNNLDPAKIRACLMTNEKPGGHGERSVAVAAGLGLGGNESYPDLFQPYGGFPDGVAVEGGYITMPELAGIGFEGKSDLYREMKALTN